MASELASDLQDTLNWGRRWLVDFNAEKTLLVSFEQSNNTGAIDVKMDGFVYEENSSFEEKSSSSSGVDFLYQIRLEFLHYLY